MKKTGLVFLFCICVYFVNAEEFLNSAPKPNSSNKEYCIDDLSSLDNPWLQTVAQAELFLERQRNFNTVLFKAEVADINPKGQMACQTIPGGCAGIVCVKHIQGPICPEWAGNNCTPLPGVPCGGLED